jgi:hypothetical protein
MRSKFWFESLNGRYHSKDLGLDVRILKWIKREIGFEDVNWIHLAQDRDRRQAVVNTVMNILIS